MDKRKYKILIAGAGGIGRAAGLLLRELGDFGIDLFIGDLYLEFAESAAQWIQKDSKADGVVQSFRMPEAGSDQKFEQFLSQSDIVLDCLPGNQAPRIAELAHQNQIHYANLTEYVEETEKVKQIACGSEKGFILQSGLAPGFVDVLANGLYQKFCQLHKVDQVESVNMKVGALTQNAYPPHYYGFTWSPVGVATLYIKPAQVIRGFKTINQASLTERSKIILNGIEYEEDLTSGGAADLPVALAGKTRNLDYKTLRYPGHFAWIDSILRQIPHGEDWVQTLQAKMEETIPLVEEDQVVIYASVLGRDPNNKLHIMQKNYLIDPVEICGKRLRAIQATTAAGLAESARLLLSGKYEGCVLQSAIDTEDFLNGPFIKNIYK